MTLLRSITRLGPFRKRRDDDRELFRAFAERLSLAR